MGGLRGRKRRLKNFENRVAAFVKALKRGTDFRIVSRDKKVVDVKLSKKSYLICRGFLKTHPNVTPAQIVEAHNELTSHILATKPKGLEHLSIFLNPGNVIIFGQKSNKLRIGIIDV